MSEENTTPNISPELQEIEYIKQDMVDLQVAYTHQQDHIEILDKVLLELREEIVSLQNQLQMLEDKVNTSNENSTHFNIQEERPPHY